jgi:hypothetical protein
MQQTDLIRYLTRFFMATGCTLLPSLHHGQIRVRLTEKMDQLLMNRPFYWHYIHQTGGTPETATLVLNTDLTLTEGEPVYPGSPRLRQIFEVSRQLAMFIRMYQKIPEQGDRALEPWIELNVKISDQCDLKRDRMASIGLQLINGTLIEGFHQVLNKLALSSRMPDYCYTLTPLITVRSGLTRIEKLIEKELRSESSEWADEAEYRWNQDQRLLDLFYEHETELPDVYTQECETLKELYQPRTTVRLVNAGLYYLRSETFLPERIINR